MTDGLAALGSVTKIEKDVVAPSDIHEGIIYVGLENITSEGQFVGVRSVDRGELASAKFRFDDRHVLFGKLRPYLAKIARPDFEGICSTDILPILPGPDLDRGYLFHFLRQPKMVTLAASRTTGANLPRLSPKVLAQFRLPLPPLEEQRRIADVLDRADDLRAKRRTALEQLETLKQSIFLEMFGSAGQSDLEPIPLGQAVDYVTVGHVGPTSAYFRDEGVPFLRTGNIGSTSVVRKDLKYITEDFHKRLRKSTLKAGDVLVSRVISDEIRCAVLPADLEGANCANVIVIRPGRAMSSEYLAHLIRLPRSQRAFLKRRVGSAQSVVNTKVLQGWMVPVPPLVMQQEFEQRMKVVQGVLELAEESSVELEDMLSSLQQRAFAGAL